MAGLTFDAGALIAADRNDRRFWALWKVATLRHVVARVPAPALAQAWRGGRNAQIARVVSACQVVPMDAPAARRAGELCGLAGTSDVVDAFVVQVAAERGDTIVTSDPDDLLRLAQHAVNPVGLIAV